MLTNVLIVGAGPSGLSLALLLLRNGLSVRIIEKQNQFPRGERGAGMHPRTLELYKFLGVLPDLLKRSGGLPGDMLYYPSPDDGKPPRPVPFIQILDNTPDRPLNNGRMLGQNRHEELLREHIFADYGVQVELGTELRSFEQSSENVIAHIVKTVDSKEVEEVVTIDWLVGADGARSVVRKQLGFTFLGESRTEVTAIIGDIHVVGDSIKQSNAWMIWGHTDSQRTAMLRPALVPGQNLFSFIISGDETELAKATSSREKLIQLFYEVTGRRDIEFGELVWMSIWRPNIRMANNLSQGRIFLVGDAAHVHSPTGGQGMNTGVQDSFNLAWKLALVQNHLAPRSLLDSYSQERLPVITSMLNRTTELFNKELIGKSGQRRDMVRGKELGGLGINYRGSRVIQDEKFIEQDQVNDPYRSGEDGTVRGGDRAPDAPLLVQLGDKADNIITLFDIFKSVHHTVLIFPGSGREGFVEEVIETIHGYPSNVVKTVVVFSGPYIGPPSKSADMTVVDTEGYAYLNYGVARDIPTVVIIRPDGYIGALVTSGKTGISNYFGSIFV